MKRYKTMTRLSAIAPLAIGLALLSLTADAQTRDEQGDALYVAPNGNVGIGTSNPPSRLSVEGNTTVNGNVGIGTTTPSSRLSVEGNTALNGAVTIGTAGKNNGQLEVNGRIKDQAGYIMPVGSIIMYSPKRDELNNLFDERGVGRKGTNVEGWAICNGMDGRPDLRGRFIVGAGKDNSRGSLPYTLQKDYQIADTGGAAMPTLTLRQMPRHNHKFDGIIYRDALIDAWGDKRDWGFLKTQNNGINNDPKMEQVGDNEPFENRPPYYALLYLIKL